MTSGNPLITEYFVLIRGTSFSRKNDGQPHGMRFAAWWRSRISRFYQWMSGLMQSWLSFGRPSINIAPVPGFCKYIAQIYLNTSIAKLPNENAPSCRIKTRHVADCVLGICFIATILLVFFLKKAWSRLVLFSGWCILNIGSNFCFADFYSMLFWTWTPT